MLHLEPGKVAIESIAHACFRLHSAGGGRVLIDPHFDHDGGEFIGRPVPWTPDIRVLRDPGTYTVDDFQVTGIRGKHADPWGKEFGQKNTIWRVEVDGLAIAHLGDNGPLTESNIRELGRVDILMMPIDAREHILKNHEVEAIRDTVRPRIVIPMHYRHPDLETFEDSPRGLGPIDPWLAGRTGVTRLESHHAVFRTGAPGSAERIVVFEHSPKVRAARSPA
jgi:L-ascorbate metabolism protein UlaG (beta-lactamase superfamily)